MYDKGAHSRPLAALTGLIGDGHGAASSRRELDQARLSTVYSLAAAVLTKLGSYDQARLTADRARTWAEVAGSPLASAAAIRELAIVPRHQDRGAEALSMTEEARRAARRLPAAAPAGRLFPISPAAVDLYAVGVHRALGDAGAALETGKNLRPAQFPTAERKAHMGTDMARAWWVWGWPEQTARSLLNAYRASPGEVRDRPAIRSIVDALAQRPPTSGANELHAATTRQGR